MTGLIRDLLRGVNEAIDENNLSSLEKSHIPALTLPDKVRPGKPTVVRVDVEDGFNQSSHQYHSIHSIELARVDFLPGHSEPRAELTVLLPSGARYLRAIAHCSVHGSWLGTAEIHYEQD